MGNEFSGNIRSELLNSKKITGYSPAQLKTLREKFVLICDDDLTIDAKNFKDIMRVGEEEVREVFRLFDIDSSGKIDSYEFICGIAMLGHATLEEKAEVIFGLFDFDSSLELNKDEVVVLFRCVICSLQSMCGKKSFPTIIEMEKKTGLILAKYDLNENHVITLHEYTSIIKKDPEILTLLKGFGFLLSDDIRIGITDERSLAECDSDLDNEVYQQEPSPSMTFHPQKSSNLPEEVIKERLSNIKKTNLEMVNNDAYRPTIYKNKDFQTSSPDINIEPVHVNGFRAYDSRNTLKINANMDLVSISGSSAWVVNRKTSPNQQKIFQNHKQAISCIANYEGIFATGEMGPDPVIHVWEGKSLSIKFSLSGILKEGVSHICFSNDGKKLAALEIAQTHTVVIYDFSKLLTGKITDLKEQVIGIYSGPKKSLGLLPYREQNIQLMTLEGWNNGNFTLLCLATLPQCIVAGMQSGQLVAFSTVQQSESAAIKSAGADKLSQVYAYERILTDQHKGPCGAIWTLKQNRGFISGGYDGSILVWNQKAGLLRRIELQTEIKTRPSSFKIKSICDDGNADDIIVGTKGGDVFEVAQNKPVKLVMKGHLGEVVGLDKLGHKGEFVTVGKDKELIIWDLVKDSKEKKRKVITLDFEACKVASSVDGTHVAVGFLNGYIQIIDVGNSNPIKKIKDRSAPILIMKYSSTQDLSLLAVGAEDFKIIIYNRGDSYKCYGTIKGLKYSPRFFDFTADSNQIRVVDDGFILKFYNCANEKSVKRTESVFELKDYRWASWTCPIGWEVSGLLGNGLNSDGTIDRTSLYYNLSCMAVSPDKSLLAVGLKDGRLRFYRYPCFGENPPYLEYYAHSSSIQGIVFCDQVSSEALDYHFVTIGKEDRNVIQWRCLRSGDKGNSSSLIGASLDKDEIFLMKLGKNKNSQAHDNDVVVRDIQESNKAFNVDSWAIPIRQAEAPDQNLELKHLFGCKFEGMTSFAKFSSTNSVVYFSSNKGIVQESSKENKLQSFFTMHKAQIMAMDIHKNRELVATGDSAGSDSYGQIYIWYFQTKTVVGSMRASSKGGITKLKFSSEGTKLLSVNNDKYHILDIWDYANSRLITSVQVDVHPLLDISFKSDNEFMTLASTSPRFWEFKGSNLSSTLGNWSMFVPLVDKDKKDQPPVSNEPEILVSCIYAFLQNICFTGTANGKIYTWQNNAYTKAVEAHDGAVRVMHCYKNILYTGGDDGIIKTWSYSGKLAPIKQVVLPILTEKNSGFEIRNLDISSEHFYLVGTDRAKLFMANESGSADAYSVVAETHACIGINALAVHPMTAQFVTAGNDGKLIKWDIQSKTCIETSLSREQSHSKGDYIVALDWSINGEFIAAGTAKGTLCLFDKSLSLKSSLESSFTGPDQRISVIKISPVINKLIVSATNSTQIKFYDIIDNGPTISPGGGLIGDIHADCRYIDWSDDGEFIAFTLDSYEIKFGMMKDQTHTLYAKVKEKNWITWTQPIGPTVKGIKLDEKEIKYNPVCRSTKFAVKAKDHEIKIDQKMIRLFLATGDRHGDVHLYRYPSVYPNSDCKSYNALAQPLTCVRIFANDSFVVAISDKDNTIAIFEADFKNDKKAADNVEAVLAGVAGEQVDADEAAVDPNNQVVVRASLKPKRITQRAAEVMTEDNQDLAKLYKISQHQADAQRFTLPWMAAIRYPTDYLKPPINSALAPKLKITPEFVFGFRAKDCRDNLSYLSAEEIVFATGALVVVHNLIENRQRFFCDHRADVTCFSIIPMRNIAASGEIGMHPLICVWSTDSLTSIRKIRAEGTHGLAKIQFCPSGPFLLTLHVDPHSTVAVFNYLTGVKIHSVHGDGPSLRIMDVRWIANDEFVSVGMNHIKFWRFDGALLSDIRGKMNPKTGQKHMVCCAVNKKDIVVGTIEGEVLVWKRSMISDFPQIYPVLKNKKAEKSGCVDCIAVTEQNLFIATEEGNIHVWSNNYKDLFKLNYSAKSTEVISLKVRSIDTFSEGKRIIIGTYKSEICELSSSDLKVTQNSKYELNSILKAPFALDSIERYEMWGLALYTNEKKEDNFVTCSDDGFVRIWSVAEKKLLGYIELNANTKLEVMPFSDDSKLRCICVNKQETAAVGCKSGLIRIVSLKEQELRQISFIDITKAAIRDLKYAPNGSMLAVGAEPQVFELYSTNDNKRRAALKKHNGPVNHLDWSANSQFVQTTSESQELMFFSAQDTQHLTELKPNVRNETWNTQSSVYGWSVQGIWKNHMRAGTEINMVDRSNNKFYGEYHALAAVDDFGELQVYKYPCVQPEAQSVMARGHSSFVSNVKWSADDQYIITTGGEDQTIIMWRVETTG